ncbi:MAG: type transport system permease protein [Actinomycetota bacterium]|nr:type transport system permease protein [Actinomycetota bacterium]
MDSTPAAGVLGGRQRPAEPRREIWFTRRIRPREALKELWAARELVHTIAERDLRARYKQAVLGLAWAVVTPFVLMVAFTLFFRPAAHVETNGVPYPLFAYLGLLPWTFFSTSVSKGGLSLTDNVALLNKIYCPREVFPLAALIVAGFDTVVSLIGLAVVFVATGFMPKATSVWVPLLLVVQLAFTAGVTLAVSSILVYVRDLKHALTILLQVGLFATPVAYGIDRISRSTRLLYSTLNPLAPVIEGYRRAVLYGKPPEWTMLLAGVGTSTVVLLGGYYLFKKLEAGIADVA